MQFSFIVDVDLLDYLLHFLEDILVDVLGVGVGIALLQGHFLERQNVPKKDLLSSLGEDLLEMLLDGFGATQNQLRFAL